MSQKNFSEVLKTRRSVYALAKKSPVSDARIKEIVTEAVSHVPSAFNSMSSRTVILLGKKHDAFWDHTLDVLKGFVTDPEALKQTEGRIGAFKGAYGTVLFFEDQAVVADLQAKYAIYKDNFPIWSQNSAGMLQYVVWASFAAEGIGANLQHYNPLVDSWAVENLGVPASWKLVAQMPFGAIAAPAGEKVIAGIDERVRVLS